MTSIVAPCQVLVAAEHGPSHRGRGQEEGSLHLAEARQPVTSTDLMWPHCVVFHIKLYVFIFYIFYIIEGLCNMIALCLFIRPVACDTVLSNVLVIFMLRWLSNTRRPTYSTQYLYLLIWDGIYCCRLQRYNYFIEINFTAARGVFCFSSSTDVETANILLLAIKNITFVTWNSIKCFSVGSKSV